MKPPKGKDIVNVTFEEFNRLRLTEIKYQQLVQERTNLINENNVLKREIDFYKAKYFQFKRQLESLTKV